MPSQKSHTPGSTYIFFPAFFTRLPGHTVNFPVYKTRPDYAPLLRYIQNHYTNNHPNGIIQGFFITFDSFICQKSLKDTTDKNFCYTRSGFKNERCCSLSGKDKNCLWEKFLSVSVTIAKIIFIGYFSAIFNGIFSTANIGRKNKRKTSFFSIITINEQVRDFA